MELSAKFSLKKDLDFDIALGTGSELLFTTDHS